MTERRNQRRVNAFGRYSLGSTISFDQPSSLVRLATCSILRCRALNAGMAVFSTNEISARVLSRLCALSASWLFHPWCQQQGRGAPQKSMSTLPNPGSKRTSVSTQVDIPFPTIRSDSSRAFIEPQPILASDILLCLQPVSFAPCLPQLVSTEDMTSSSVFHDRRFRDDSCDFDGLESCYEWRSNDLSKTAVTVLEYG
jgi:hypothetical protein